MTMVGLRKLWFQVHKWIGLILAVLIIPISLTGSALVWHEPIEQWLHPERHAVTGPANLAPEAYAAAAQAALGKGERLARLEMPRADGEPVTVSATRAGKGRPQRISAYLDPATGRLLATERSGEGVFALFHSLHGSLMLPGVGRQIVGWIGVAMLIMSVTGLWLWWPLSGSFRRGLRWKRHPKNTDTNLHHLTGFWISLPLFVLSLTGIWISFPQVFAGLDGGVRPRPPARSVPVAAPVLPVGEAIADAQALAPGKVATITWPTEAQPRWEIAVRGKRAASTVRVDDLDGTTELAERSPRQQPQTIARLMRRIHDGGDTPFVWQLIVFLGGLAPALLAITGIIMWWRARGWRGEVADRKRGVSA